MDTREKEKLSVARNLAISMIADATEELHRVLMDEANSEVETIESMRDKALSIAKVLDDLLS